MSTGKDYGLPEEYHDWVEWDASRSIYMGPILRITAEMAPTPDAAVESAVWRISLIPPRPVLPDVKPGAVIRYRGATDRILRRAIRNPDRTTWTVWSEDLGLLHDKCADSGITEAVDDDGFTVELEGL